MTRLHVARELRANVAALGLAAVDIRGEPVERVLARPPDSAYDVVFVDPPYPAAVDDALGCVC